jgi:hypothetical protein
VDVPEGVDTGELDTEELDTEELDTEELDTEELDTEELDTEELDTEELDTEELDTEELDTEELDTGETITGDSPRQIFSPFPRATIARTNASYSDEIRVRSSAKYSRNTAGPTCRPMAMRRSFRVPARLDSHKVPAIRPSTASERSRSRPLR